MRVVYVVLSLLILAFFWGLAYLVALNDIDFFTFRDLFDFTQPHHEHIVAALGVFGLVGAVIALVQGALDDRRQRAWLASGGY